MQTKQNNNKLPYPFDILPMRKGSTTISKEMAKALIVKFLKRENIFYEVITECMLSHPQLTTVTEVLENMVKGAPCLHYCLWYSERMFSWSDAQRYHVGNNDNYWSDLLRKWVATIGENTNIQVK